MVTWVVQKQQIEARVNVNAAIRAACGVLFHDYVEVDIVPFTHDVDGEAPLIDGPVIVHGSTAMVTTAKIHGWTPGVFKIYNESDTLAALGDLYLNHDMKVLDPADVVEYVESRGWDFFFAKPDRDLKSFDGTVFDVKRFPYFIERVSKYGNYQPDTKVCVSGIKNPVREWRFVMVNGEVVAGSQYRTDRNLDVKPCADAKAVEFANWVSTTTATPADVFVMDVCEIDSQYKVVEYNTFNCSGVYACDIHSVVEHVSRYVSERFPDTSPETVPI